MKKNRLGSYVVGFDKTILLCYVLLAIIGLIVMLDISSVQSSMMYFYRQLVFIIFASLVALFILYYPNLEKLRFTN
ncbi:MAG TPA: cell division protein FtsW, partial [Candidatus Cloacimonadota bacterium]|nr:cell division protein FtsW [Candidatus Cloacimonadota bacterium]